MSENAPVITPTNRLLNRMQEIARGGARHGSCGFGIGLTQADVETLGDGALYVRDLPTAAGRRKLFDLWEQKRSVARQLATAESCELLEQFETLDLDYYAELFAYVYHRASVVTEAEFRALVRSNDSVFEGAQGVLLDQVFGFFPHCTRSTCTFENAETLLKEAGFSGVTTRVGLLRGYGTRHGAGPFMTEDTGLTLAPCHNQVNPWQGTFRLGWFDTVTARYALEAVGGVDTLAITNLDRLWNLPRVKVGIGYDDGTDRLELLKFDKAILTRWTEALFRLRPRYLELPGWSNEGMVGYVQKLSELLDHPIHAYSASPSHDKIYL